MKIQDIIIQLEDSYNGTPWYGKPLMTFLEEIQSDELNLKCNKEHSIGQILQHMLARRAYTLSQLQGVPNDLKVNTEGDWSDVSYSEIDFEDFKMTFQESHESIISELRKKPDDILNQVVPGKSYNFEKLLVGIIQHDIYHLGQLFAIKSSFKS